jgi:aromatic ring hydroxylase
MTPDSTRAEQTSYVITGGQYRESLRDGRRIVFGDEEVADVTTHPAFRGGVDLVAGYFDLHADPAFRDALTFRDPVSGAVKTAGWLVPRSKEDLRHRREALQISTRHTFGLFGRPPDYGSTFVMGFLSVLDLFEEHNPRLARNVVEFVERAGREAAICADVFAETQSDRTVPNAERKARLRVVEERPDGVVVYGAKAVGSVGAIGNYCVIANLIAQGIDPKAIIWAVCPVNAEGLTLVSREQLTPSDGAGNHPVDSRGEESDTLYVFDHVFIPWEHVFMWGAEHLLGLYYRIGVLGHWHVLSRLWYRAEIFAGLAQAIVNVLGTDSIPGVRAVVADVFTYASSLRAFVLAAEAEGTLTKGGVYIPSIELVTAGRLHSLVRYPDVIHALRDLAGQGLISRFPDAVFERERLREQLDDFLGGQSVSARDKNRLFNLVWDLTCSAHAARVALFENVNSLPPAWIREGIYQSYDRKDAVEFVLSAAGVRTAPAEEVEARRGPELSGA